MKNEKKKEKKWNIALTMSLWPCERGKDTWHDYQLR